LSDNFLQSAYPSSLAAIIDRFFLSIDNYILWLIIILLFLSFIAYFTKQMTVGGIVGAFSLGLLIILSFGFGGLTILLFFVLSAAILSKLNKNNEIYKEAEEIQEKHGRRDIVQVFANGGLSFVLAIIYLINFEPIILVMFGASVAEALSDTAGGEIGMFFKGKAVSIVTGKAIKPGLSGGVSLEGTIGSLMSSFIISILWYSTYCMPSLKTVYLLVIVTLSGFVGSLIDSILGDTIQAHYYDEENDKIIESEFNGEKKLPLVKGVKFFNNDMVNFISNLFSIMLASLFYVILI